jgi:hypothetical protein
MSTRRIRFATGFFLAAWSLLLCAAAGAVELAVHPLLEPYQVQPALRAAVTLQLAGLQSPLPLPFPAATSLAADPALAARAVPAAADAAELARQYIVALKAHEAEIGAGPLEAALGAVNARALASLRVDPRALADVRRGAPEAERTAARFNALFDGRGAAAGAEPIAAAVGVTPSRPSGLAAASLQPRAPAAETVPANGTLVFLTDFGLKDPAVGICKLVMAGINSALNVVDLSHLVPPFNVGLAADFLAAAIVHARPGTVFVAVVDPGVGGARKSIAARTSRGHLLVGPDNGLFAKAVAAAGLDKVFELANPAYFHSSGVSSTFHGRDIYAPVGAHLASGVRIEDLGPELDGLAPLAGREAVLENGEIRGRVAYVEDPFGSVLTDIPRSLVEEAGWRPRQGLRLEVRVGDRTATLPYEKTFSDVPAGAPLALIHSREVLSFSLNQGHFGDAHGVKEGALVVVRAAPPD